MSATKVSHLPAVKVIPALKRFVPMEKRSAFDTIERRKLPKLPPAYLKFYSEWKDHDDEATPVHYVPKHEHWVRNPETGEMKRIQNRPIPIFYPDQVHTGIWGGCGVVEGLVKKGKYKCPVPWFWVPPLHKSVVYSEILDSYMSVVITKRALELIDQNFGLDAYLLTNPCYELKSLLAIKIKKKILYALATRDFCHEDLAKQERLFEKYKQYLIPEELEWYGLSVDEATAKFEFEKKSEEVQKIEPLKFQFRQALIEKLKAEQVKASNEGDQESSNVTSWISKLNPFSKPSNAPEERKVNGT